MVTLLPSVTLPPTVPSTTKPFGPSPVPVAAEMMTVGPDAVAEYSGDDVLMLICAATAVDVAEFEPVQSTAEPRIPTPSTVTDSTVSNHMLGESGRVTWRRRVRKYV